MRIRNPRVTALVFSTGKVVLTGAKSEHDSFQAAKIYFKTIQKIQEQSKLELTDFKIQNIVACGDAGFSIKLESLKEQHMKFARCHYEPELFPGLIYKLEVPKVTLLIFTSGKIMLVGAKARKDVYVALQKIYPVLFTFRKQAN